jgi:hypothetical protein
MGFCSCSEVIPKPVNSLFSGFMPTQQVSNFGALNELKLEREAPAVRRERKRDLRGGLWTQQYLRAVKRSVSKAHISMSRISKLDCNIGTGPQSR